MKHVLGILLVIFFSLSLLAQGNYVPPKVPEKSCKDLDAAVLSAKAGPSEKSIATIKSLIEKYPTWTEARHHLSRIYYEAGNKEEAIKALEQSILIDTQSQLQQLFTLGRLYEENGDFEKAMTTYDAVIRNGAAQKTLVDRAAVNRKNIESKMQLLESNYTVTLKPLHEGINSPGHEALGRWTVDGRSIIFTRLLDEQEDMFIARFDETEKLLRVEEMSFNTEFREGSHAISPDGKYIVFTSCNRMEGMGGCDLFLSVMREGEWTKAMPMGPAFNSPGWESEPAFGLDGTTIYFSSNRPGGFGGNDIWFVRQLSAGKWSAPMNAGKQINTADNEESPYISFDGRTIYFMRDGKSGLGGYDLYLGRLGIDGSWTDIQNMGAPINSAADEGALSVHPDGTRALITRKTADRKNDLFEFDLPPQFRSKPVQVVYVRMIDEDTRNSIKGRVELIDIDGADTIRVSQLADEKGVITLTAERNRSYGLLATAGGYLMHSGSLSADTGAVRNVNILMTALANVSNKSFVLRNIFFETGSARLLSSSSAELNKLAQTLRENRSMKIEISGHTDNTGTDEINNKLSEARAKAVYDYLVKNNIDPARLTFKGYGSTKPVASNDTEEGRAQNRRTEFKVVSSE